MPFAGFVSLKYNGALTLALLAQILKLTVSKVHIKGLTALLEFGWGNIEEAHFF